MELAATAWAEFEIELCKTRKAYPRGVIGRGHRKEPRAGYALGVSLVCCLSLWVPIRAAVGVSGDGGRPPV